LNFFYGSNPQTSTSATATIDPFGNYAKVSDDRLKHNETPLTNALEVIMQLQPLYYDKTAELMEADFQGDLSDVLSAKDIGLIAQDVFQINELKCLVTEGDETTPWTLSYDGIFVYNIKAIQELNTRVLALEAENQVLKSSLDDLSQRLSNLENN
jgi:hypothetical protein